MAKRPSARRTSDADDVDEGDDGDSFAWETPKKGKKETGKQKSPTGKKKRPSAEEAEEEPEEDAKEKSGKKKLGKGSGSSKLAKSSRNGGMEGSSRTKKSGSARRPSSGGDGDDEEGDTSGRRRRAMPAKKKGGSPVLLISIGTVTLLLVAIIVLFNSKRTPGPQVNHQSELETILEGGKQGEAAFREWNKAKNSGGNDKPHYNEARTKLQKAIEDLQTLLEKPEYRNGPDIKPEFEGYESYLQKWAELLVDIEKGSTLDNGR